MKKEGLTHFKPEGAFVPSSPESKELVERKEIEIITNPESGKIETIGDPREVRLWLEAAKKKDPSLEITPEVGGVAAPGFTDAHHHLLYGTLDVIQAGYVFGVNSQEGMIKAIQEQIKGADKSLPKVFLGHNTATVPDIYRGDLDAASLDVPVCLCDLSFHGARLNSAMTRIVAEAAKKEIANGRKITGRLDEKTGQATEGYAMFAIQVAEAPYGVEKIADGMTGKLDEWIGQGITDIHELYPLSWGDLTAMLIARKEWREKRGTEFPVRQIFMTPDLLQQLRRDQRTLEVAGIFDPNKDWDMMGIKLVTDGSFGSHTAMMKEPFSDEGGYGMEFHSLEDLNKAIEMIKEMGITRVAQHAIGDAAIERALGIAEKWVRTAESAKMDPTRFRIEHFESSDGALDETKRLGVWVNSEPNFLTDMIYEDRLSGRVTQICPHADILQKGIPMHFGSDGMPSSALFGIWAATHHPNPKQRISFEQALAAYSMTAADYEYNTGRGRIAEGASADIIVLNRETVNEMLQGDASKENFANLGNNSDMLADKVSQLEAGIAKVFRQGRLVEKK